MPVIVASIPLMVAYPFAVAFISERSGRLARERKKAVEQTAALREQLAHIARVGRLGEMAAGLAHELNQPLTAIHLEAHTALELNPVGVPEDLSHALSRIAEQSLRAGDIVRRMRTFARRGQPHWEPIPIGQLVHEVLALLDHDVRFNAVEAMAGPGVTVRRLTIRTEAAGDAVPSLGGWTPFRSSGFSRSPSPSCSFGNCSTAGAAPRRAEALRHEGASQG